MSSIVRPTPRQSLRRLIVLACALFAVAAGYGQNALGWGQSAAEFAADSDATLQVVGWAFSIWGLIYLGLLIYAVRQALPQTGESDPIRRFGWPSVAAFLGIGWWIVAAAFDAEVLTIVLIVGAATALLVPLMVNAAMIRSLPRASRDRWLVVWPLALLAGWLTVAAPVNLITVATGNGDLPTALPPTAWAVLALVGVAGLTLAVTARTRLLAYPLPVAWGLIGVFAAEQARNPVLAFAALGAAAAVLIGAVVFAFELRPSRLKSA